MMKCKTHVSKSQSAHNLLKVFINYKTSHLNIFKKKKNKTHLNILDPLRVLTSKDAIF